MAGEGLSDEKMERLQSLLRLRKQEESLSTEEQDKLQRRAELEADFASFARAAWHVIRPGQELKWSWHYDLIAEYLTLAYERKCLRLIINIAPRSLKSILVTVLFPAWVWTKQPGHNFGCASYSGDLSTEHSVMRRNLIESDWFKLLWGDRIWLADDQNQKTKYKNNYEAQMWASSVGATIQGLGGETLIVDDALKADEAKSDVIRKTATDWFDNTWGRRLNEPATGALIVVEQRTHELDLSGYLLEQGGWTHLCLPLEAEEFERWVFPISGRVVEREAGAILQPDRFPPEVVTGLKKLRLVWSGQYQQRPAPLEGNMIKRADVRYYGGRDPVTGEPDKPLPQRFDNVLISVDCAFKDLKTSDYVCVGAIGTSGPNRYILNVVLKHLDVAATELETKRQRTFYSARVVLIEDKANGPAVIKNLRQSIPGVIEIEPQGGKVPRMFAACGEWQSGNWYVDRNAAWTEPFVESITKFPTAKYDDDVDMMTQAAIWLQQNNQTYGLIEYMKQLDKEIMNKRLGKRTNGHVETKTAAHETKAPLHEAAAALAETTATEHETDPSAHKTNGTAHTDITMNALRYVENTAGSATLANFIEDNEPIGRQVWTDLLRDGLVKIEESQIFGPRIFLTEQGAFKLHPATNGTARTDEKIAVDIPDNVDRCPECKSVLVQRVAGGKRCGQCGVQWSQPGLRMGQVSPGQLRK